VAGLQFGLGGHKNGCELFVRAVGPEQRRRSISRGMKFVCSQAMDVDERYWRFVLRLRDDPSSLTWVQYQPSLPEVVAAFGWYGS
jgi:hypothetical protein